MPASVPAGRATAVWCYGRCYSTDEPIERLRIVVDGTAHHPAAWRMPRLDAEDGGHRSGFWGTVPIEAHARPGAVELALHVRLADGAEELAPLARIEVVEPEPPKGIDAAPELPGEGLIAICMGTFDPDPDLLRAQIESLREQTDRRWVCLISDDCSSSEHFEWIKQAVTGDRRFALSRSDRRLGFYRNFERALEMIPPEAELVALCDQDDRWYPEKLEVLRGELRDAGLVYSDQRLVDHSGRVLRETFWEGRSNNHTSLVSLLVANSITGAAALLRREVAELALPFPDPPGWQFHDHWVGLVALAHGEVGYVNRPLYDYVQHRGAVFGDVGSSTGTPTPVVPPWWTLRGLRARRGVLGRWRAAYFYGYLNREVQAQVLLARCGRTMSGPKRRALRRFVSSGRSPLGVAWLAARPLRALAGRTETLGSETQLALGIVWSWIAAVAARRSGPVPRATLDARLPELGEFEQTRLRRWRAGV
jgi:glycosyltransferase involved in cell wall biosynthesis